MQLQPARLFLAAALCACLAPIAFSQAEKPAITPADKPPITLDEFFNTSEITSVRLAPDASAAVIATESPDWKNNLFRTDLWLWTTTSGLKPLTHSGSEDNPRWSPDGKWIAFLSDRALPGESSDADGAPSSAEDKASRIWIISATGGEALPLFTEKLDVHAFAWSPDSSAIYYAVTQPLTEEEQAARKEQWKDVLRWREQNRGDILVKQPVAASLAAAVENPAPEHTDKKDDSKKDDKPATQLPKGATTIAKTDLAIEEIAPAPGGSGIAFSTVPPHHRVENPADYEIFLASPGGHTKQLTHNNGFESNLLWTPDGKWLHFQVSAGEGAGDGPYREIQGRLYRLNPASGDTERLGSEFDGSFSTYTLLPDGSLLALGLKGTEQQLYKVDGSHAAKLPGRPGTYSNLDAAIRSSAILVTHSSCNVPGQAYLAADPLHPDKLTALTAFNPVFAQRAQPEFATYTWKAPDGRSVEGVLIYPPGKKGEKHLRMLTLIHGGPEDADGNRFEADWYDWAALAAARGWLVFRPNYRGSTGYGDDFMLQIAPHLVSKPGLDILSGVDALVKDGIADPDHLTVGGYSYGGYMTNWLLTQTTRFKAAATGAGAVEHAANWGNDDLTYDDAWYLGARPWENPAIYQDEAALFRFDKVKTPTHLVQGDEDIRVPFLEGKLMERALQSLNIPHTFLVFPGEGHGLGKNPWHGYIKVREELNWLEKYDQAK